MTQAVIECVRRQGRPTLPPIESWKAEVALVKTGYDAAWNESLDRLTSLADSAKTGEEPEATFGAESLMHQEYGRKPPVEKQAEQ